MNHGEFLFRLLAGGAIFFFAVLTWAVGPYVNDAHVVGGEPLNAPIMSVFFGTAQPRGVTVIALLLARGCLGMALASWIAIPAARYFYDVDFRPLARAAVIVFMTCSVAAFMGSLLAHLLIDGGGTIFA